MESIQGEFMIGQSQLAVQKIGELSFARGKVGLNNRLIDSDAETVHAEQLGLHTVTLERANTADCGDERLTLSLADGTSDPEVLRNRVVPQLFGGLGLATTKALVAADAAIVRDAKTFWQAYEKTVEALTDLAQEDGGHEGCGASASVESSVANAIPEEVLVPTLGLLVPKLGDLQEIVNHNTAVKNNRLQDGFYSGWDPQKHIDFLTNRYPKNFSYLKVDHSDHETHGHHGSSVYIVTQEVQGFAKNSFIEDTGQEAFSVTAPKIFELAQVLGASDLERRQIAVAFLDDTLHVGAGIVAPGMPVFAQK